jgi:hypothetical protein
MICSPVNYGKITFWKNRADAYFWDTQIHWQDNYQGQQFIVLDKWRPGNSIKFGILEELTDESPKIPRRGLASLEPKNVTIIICSNMENPMDVYINEKIDKSIIDARFTHVWLPEKGVMPKLEEIEEEDSM